MSFLSSPGKVDGDRDVQFHFVTGMPKNSGMCFLAVGYPSIFSVIPLDQPFF